MRHKRCCKCGAWIPAPMLAGDERCSECADDQPTSCHHCGVTLTMQECVRALLTNAAACTRCAAAGGGR